MGANTEIKIERIEDALKGKYEFRFNIVANESEYRLVAKNEPFRPLDSFGLSEIHYYLFSSGFDRFKEMLDTLLRSKLCVRFNPLEGYFKALPEWDKENNPDHIAELCSYINTVEDSGWFYRMFKAHLLRTVACAVRLIEFNKHCFVLVGKQNDGKTYLIRHLIPDELKPYYKENPPLDHKDSVIALSQNLIINIDELADLNKADANKVKSLFSQADTKIRGHYATKDAMQVRYASFFGTTNETEFLNDATGNVRWIPFTIENINHDRGGKNGYSKNVSIDDVWSQVYALVLSGEYGILRNDELSQMERQNFDYHKTTPEIDLISQLIEPSTSDDLAALAVTNTDLLQALYLYTNKTIRFTPQGLGKALTFLKHVRASARIGSKNSAVKCYYVRTKDIHFGHLLTKEPTTSTTSLQLSNN